MNEAEVYAILPREIIKHAKNITEDSRYANEETIFVAIKGEKADGHAYIKAVLQKGVLAIVAQENSIKADEGKNIYTTQNTRKALALLSAFIYKPQPQKMIAITGTNGKTSTALFVDSLVQQLGYKAGSVGTLGLQVQGQSWGESLTTPSAPVLHKMLQKMEEKGVEVVAMEASSHGLEQHRLDGVHLTTAAFTNCTQDHLDYHQTMEKYYKAKERLFTELLPNGAMAIINGDDIYGQRLIDTCTKSGRPWSSYGMKASNTFHIESVVSKDLSQEVVIKKGGEKWQFHVPMIGTHMMYNVLCAVLLVHYTMGIRLQDIFEAAQHLKNANGRLEYIGKTKKGAKIFVDYAHTPDALQRTLEALQSVSRGAISVVFGCGGNRDKKKRGLMGAIAQQVADVVYITDDNPRQEDPKSIRLEILEKCPKGIECSQGRAEAIERAIKEAKENDIILVAGKGHETTQIIGNTIHPFNDKASIKNCIDRDNTL